MAVRSIHEALLDIRKGKMVILVDDEDRENEGDLCMAAEKATPQAVNFMAKYGRGLICLSLQEEKADELQLPPMVSTTLVNPERPIPAYSKRFHGIEDDMVRDAPVLAQVLPRFYEYAGTAVLVAHNAAFDKKFLDLGAAAAGLPLMDNPVLDTLFLSYGIHRDFDGHNLDSIADRLGVTVEGRHTSLGDARATAEVFLRLLRLLAPGGVATLADAKAFCARMLLLRWQTSRF